MASYSTWGQVTAAAGKGQLSGPDFIAAIMVIGPSPAQVQQVLSTVARTEPGQAWVAQHWVQVVKGQIVILPAHLPAVNAPGAAPGINSPLPSVTSPLAGLDEIGAVLKAAFNAVTDLGMWRCVGLILLGGVLVLAGLRLWLGKPALPKMPSVIPIPV